MDYQPLVAFDTNRLMCQAQPHLHPAGFELCPYHNADFNIQISQLIVHSFVSPKGVDTGSGRAGNRRQSDGKNSFIEHLY